MPIAAISPPPALPAYRKPVASSWSGGPKPDDAQKRSRATAAPRHAAPATRERPALACPTRIIKLLTPRCHSTSLFLGDPIKTRSAWSPCAWFWAAGKLTNACHQTIKKGDYKPEDLPIWNFDGSSTEQAPGDNSDVYLRPCAIFPDPFRGAPNIIVLSECWNADGTPNKYNYRHECSKVMEAYAKHEPWFGLEQEYTLLDMDDRPLGWPTGGFPAP